MQPDRNIPLLLHRCDGADVIDMRMRYPDRLRLFSCRFDFGDDSLRLAARIDDCESVAFRIRNQIAVLLECTDGNLGDDHRGAPLPCRALRGTVRLSFGGSSTCSGEAGTGPSAVSRIGDSPMPA